jgi:CRP/FNR family cyclic AMP-dependent transcriptional regulator
MAAADLSPLHLRTALASDPWFASCDDALQHALIERGRLVRLARGEALFSRGDIADGLCCVVAGALRVGALQADGSESLLAYLEPYQWFGEISMLDGQPRTHDAAADAETTVLVIAQPALLEWLAQHPAHWRDLGRLACQKLRIAFTTLEDIAHLPLQQRLAKRLWLVAHGYGAWAASPRRQVRLPQEQLALMLGVTRQSMNKALRALEAQGLVALRYGTIELPDLDALRALGEAGGPVA